MNPMLSQAGLARVAAAVAAVERHTAGEVVVVVAQQSATWSGVRGCSALLASSAVAVVGAAFVDDALLRWLAVAVPATACVAWIAAGWFVRVLASDDALDGAVASAAKAAFVDTGVSTTTARAGVLIYVSLLERRVHLLADTRAHALVGGAGWSLYARRVATAMKGHAVDELIAVVGEVGETLAGAFPRRDQQENRLQNVVVVDDRAFAARASGGVVSPRNGNISGT
jgi:putative membrane protein